MAGSVNKVLLVGNLTRDIEVRDTQNGNSIGTLTVATSESWKDKQSGERKEKAEFHRVVIFNDGLVKAVGKYLTKGVKVYIEGQLQTRKWQDKEGNEKYSTEVVVQGFGGRLELLSAASRRSGEDVDPEEPPPPPGGAKRLGPKTSDWRDEVEPEIPF